ncbi:hypothetical protein N665_0055s0015 [Sinapis alba]|nr:hypothetical protein N665_0055s0015 [Sinapis alba]
MHVQKVVDLADGACAELGFIQFGPTRVCGTDKDRTRMYKGASPTEELQFFSSFSVSPISSPISSDEYIG